MEVAKCVLAFDSFCGARTGVAKCLVAFNSLWTGLVIVTSNEYTVFVYNCVIIDLILNNSTNSLNTPHPLFPGKIVN